MAKKKHDNSEELNLVEAVIDDHVSEFSKEEEAEIKEYVDEEFRQQKAPLKRPSGLIEAPSATTPIKDHKDRTLCLFGDDSWPLLYHGSTVNANFAAKLQQRFPTDDATGEHNGKGGAIHFTGDENAPLRRLMKTLFYFKMPNTWPGTNSVSVGTALGYKTAIRHFAAYLYRRGFLMDTPGVPTKPLKLIDVDDLKACIRKSIANEEPGHRVQLFFYLITYLIHLCEFVDMPEMFRLPFGHAEWSGDVRFENEIKVYTRKLALRTWSAIGHDDLVRLLGNAQRYTQDYANDILLMNDCLVALARRKAGNLTFERKTNDLHQAITTNPFVKDVDGKPWFRPTIPQKIRRGRREQRIHTGPMKAEVLLLAQSCIFLLLFWTAMRVLELVNVKANGLFINGKRHDPANNAYEAFRDAVGANEEKEPVFELEFTTFKLSRRAKGKKRKLPLTRDAARAFCLLVELFRARREKEKSEFLLPPGFSIKATKGENVTKGKKDAVLDLGTIRSHLNQMISSINQRYGWQINSIHPHQTRKSIATIIINKDPRSIELIQRMLGHKYPTMTMRYLMQLPGIAEPVLNYLIETNRSRILEIMTAAMSGKIAGQRGEKIGASFNKKAKQLKAEMAGSTLVEVLDRWAGDPNLIILEAPAAWCLRLKSFRPEQLPCLPKIDFVEVNPEEVVPDITNCRPRECGHAAHTERHLRKARRLRRSAEKHASNSKIRAELKSEFELQAIYWRGVEDALVNGARFSENPEGFDVDVGRVTP